MEYSSCKTLDSKIRGHTDADISFHAHAVHRSHPTPSKKGTYLYSREK